MSIYKGTTKISGGGGGGSFDASSDQTITGTWQFNPGSGETAPYFNGGLRVGADASANLLDDYEEGTFTPTSSNSGITYTGTEGVYTKIGDMVWLRGRFTVPSNTSTATVGLTSFPFPVTSGDTAMLFNGRWLQDNVDEGFIEGSRPRIISSVFFRNEDGTSLTFSSQSGNELYFEFYYSLGFITQSS